MPRSCFNYAVGAHHLQSGQLRQLNIEDGEHNYRVCILIALSVENWHSTGTLPLVYSGSL
jgi:hypothetical protein